MTTIPMPEAIRRSRAKRAIGYAALGSVLMVGPTQGVDAKAGEWIDVPPQSLVVQAGSALDLSALAAPGPAGARGRPRPSPEGELVFAGDGSPARFNCAMLASGQARTFSYPTHAETDRLVVQLRRAGYTLARLHNADIRLMPHARRDLDIDPEQLDRLHYLLAALKKQGIAWMIDVLSVGSKTLDGPHWDRPTSPDDVRVRLSFDDKARSLWLGMVDKVYAARNPYTGRSTLEDPALAFVVGANENGIAFSSATRGKLPTGLAGRFDAWLHHRYAAPSALAAAVPDLTPAERIGTEPIAPPRDWVTPSRRNSLFLTFVAELERQGYDWMTAELASRGFDGPVVGFHEWSQGLDNRVRSTLPVIDVHAYSGEVSTFRKGASLLLPPSAGTGLDNWTVSTAARWLGRPMIASEWGQPYPNPTRYEGILFPALAAFQGYSTICQTAFMPVEREIPPAGTRIAPLQGYTVGFDPVTRAEEVLSAMLFFRQDVRPATLTIAVPFGGNLFGQPNSAYMPGTFRKAALLGRFGLIAPEKIGTLPPDSYVLKLPTQPDAGGALDKAERFLDANGRFDEMLAALRASGSLDAGNRTDGPKGILQSHTGELTVDQRTGRISIVTPRTEALSTLAAAAHISLGRMNVRRIDSPALVAATALDGRSLEQSSRILLILTGDAQNTGLQLGGGGDRRTMEAWGTWPIQMRRVRADLTFPEARGNPWRLSALALDGGTMKTVPLRSAVPGGLSLTLDTAMVAGRPTTYFLLER